MFAHLTGILTEFATLEAEGPAAARRARLRSRLIAGYLPLARRLAWRYARRGESVDDLVQVATVGLINAIDRFQPGFGCGFLAYAVPTITGELRRYFRDQTWPMQVPRRYKELRLLVNNAVDELTGELGRAPRASQIAARLDLPLDDVLQGLQACHAYHAYSLDQTLDAGSGGQATVGDLVGEADSELEMVDYRESLHPLLGELPVREQRILMMRFFGNMTQTQIAEQTGISQMHVSRLLSDSLGHLRERLLSDEPNRPSGCEPDCDSAANARTSRKRVAAR